MRNASTEFRDDKSKIYYQIPITLSNGTILDNLENKNIFSGGIEIRDYSSTDSSFDIGGCVMRELILRLWNEKEMLSHYDFANAKVSVVAKMDIGDITQSVSMGKYIVDLPEFSGDTIILNCVDRMMLFNKKIDDISGTTAGTIVNFICTRFGVTLATQTFDGYDVDIELPEDVTDMKYIELLSYICQVTCNFARFNDDGDLEIKWYDTSVFDGISLIDGKSFTEEQDTIIDGGDFNSYQTDNVYDAGSFDMNYHRFYSNTSEKIVTEDVVITGIKVKNDDVEELCGTEGYVLVIEDNPLTIGKEKQIAENIALRCVGMRFRPFSISTQSNILVEAGDACIVTDRKGNSYYSYITNTTFKVGSTQTVGCNAESPVQNSADGFSLVTEAVIKARKETDKKITAYDVAVQHLTDLMANSFGVFKTAEQQEDGSSIYYMHDKSLLSESTTIWKMTSDAFAVSTDGGKSWNAGFDSSGNAVVNILNAIGINADWINAGTLTGRKIDNGNGTFSVDENGNVISNSFKSKNAEITGGSILIDSISDATKQLIRLATSVYSTYMAPNAIGVKCVGNSNLKACNSILGAGGLYVYDASNSAFISLNEYGFNIPSLAITCKSVTQSSDYRLKKHKRGISKESKLINLLKPVTYKFKKKLDKTGKRHIGFYAQDLIENMKTVGLDPDEYGLVEMGTNGYYSINYTELIPLLVANIQEMNHRIEVLENGDN